jgi:hypothetical protein
MTYKNIILFAMIGTMIFGFLVVQSITEDLNIDSNLLFEYRLALGSKSPYIPPHSETLGLHNMTLIQVHMVSRHAARYWTKKKHLAMFEVVDYLRSRVNRKLHPQLAHLQIPFPKEQASQLAPVGKHSAYNLGRRFHRRYGMFLPNQVMAYSSSSQRALDSMHYFLKGFGHHIPHKVIQNRTLDADLNPELSCTKFALNAHENSPKLQGMMWMEQYIDELVERMNRLVGIPLTMEQVKTILEICAAQISLLGYRRNEGICYLLSDHDLKNYEIHDDVMKYHGFSYGNDFNADIACSLVTSLVNDISDNEQISTLRFTHAETMIPLITAFGMFKDDKPISGNLSFHQLRKRVFRTSLFSPFQGNLIIEVYGCEDEKCLRVLVNERPILMPNCNYINGLCSFSNFQMLLKRYIGCNYDLMCQNSYHTVGGWNI